MENIDPNIITPIVAIIIGLILAFAGYRIKRIAMAIIWFVIGYTLVKTYLPNLIEDPFWQTILQIAAGAILSMIGLSIEKLAVSLTAGAVVTMFIIKNFGPVENWTLPAIAIACGVVAGVIAVWMMKPAVILFTAIHGANLIAINIMTFLPDDVIANIPYLQIVIFAVIATAGTIFQWNNTKNIE
jgi:hypothetical protein